jgi:hypothetical protein
MIFAGTILSLAAGCLRAERTFRAKKEGGELQFAAPTGMKK